MLPQHKEIFYAAAQHLNCWIGLREPNELADKWIGKPGFVPKGVTCKAKTSDNDSFGFSGLVVNPLLCPGAFKQSTLQDAIEKWEQFSGGGNQLPPGFTFDKDGREKGLLKYHGSAIHADYDLMAVCNAGDDGEIGNTSNEQENELFDQVERFLNMRFNTKMIQHGSEFMYKDGVGARETEQVYFFGPNRRFKLSYSSMPRKAMAH